MAVTRDAGPSVSQSLTFEAFGNDEDFSPIITNIDPDKTPFLSTLTEEEDAVEANFSWITEGLRPPQVNAHLEKEDYTSGKVGSLRSLTNNVQIFINSGWVSDMQRKTRKIYNQQDEFDRQKTKAFTEHARDIEYAIVSNSAKVAGGSATAAKTGGIPFFLNSSTLACSLVTSTGVITTTSAHELTTGDFVYFNADTLPTGLAKDMPYYVRVASTTTFTIFSEMQDAIENVTANQVKPSTTGTNLVMEINNVTDLGGAADYTLADINSVMQMCYLRGGNPNKLWMNPAKKARFSSLLTATATTNRKSGEKKVNLIADTLETDFGQVTAHPHLWYPRNRMDAIDDQYMALKWFARTHDVTGLAKKGNYSEFVIEGSIGLKCVQPHACASIINIKA